MNTGQGAASGLNALTFDKVGNVYLSDSFLGDIWKTGRGRSSNSGQPQNAAASRLANRFCQQVANARVDLLTV